MLHTVRCDHITCFGGGVPSEDWIYAGGRADPGGDGQGSLKWRGCGPRRTEGGVDEAPRLTADERGGSDPVAVTSSLGAALLGSRVRDTGIVLGPMPTYPVTVLAIDEKRMGLEADGPIQSRLRRVRGWD